MRAQELRHFAQVDGGGRNRYAVFLPVSPAELLREAGRYIPCAGRGIE